MIRRSLSVRDTEKLAKKVQEPRRDKPRSRPNAEKDADTRALEGDLSAGLGMKVSIDHKPGQEAGQVTIRYASLEELDELCRALSAVSSGASR